MRSRYADVFNHDEDAADYDADVRDASNPIRAGYAAVLDWVAVEVRRVGGGPILELGSGTGNLTARLGPFERLVCVDVSGAMTRLARAKPALAGNAAIEWVRADVLEYVDRYGDTHVVSGAPRFDVVASTYTLHHLTEDEKPVLFRRLRDVLRPGGALVCGDLMFAGPAARARLLDDYRQSGRGDLAAEIEAEFFWDLERALPALEALGFTPSVRRFSDLSWGLMARLDRAQ